MSAPAALLTCCACEAESSGVEAIGLGMSERAKGQTAVAQQTEQADLGVPVQTLSEDDAFLEQPSTAPMTVQTPGTQPPAALTAESFSQALASMTTEEPTATTTMSSFPTAVVVPEASVVQEAPTAATTPPGVLNNNNNEPTIMPASPTEDAAMPLQPVVFSAMDMGDDEELASLPMPQSGATGYDTSLF